MVCPRCISAVKSVLNGLSINYKSVELGQVDLEEKLTKEQEFKISENLQKLGFEILDNSQSKLVSQIKSLIINHIHYGTEELRVNYSDYLAEKLNHEYSYMSRLFSSIEGITIEKFISKQKIEKVKELLFYNELTLSEIAFLLNYSNVAYLSTQFKKETGMTPSAFKASHKPGHANLDAI